MDNLFSDIRFSSNSEEYLTKKFTSRLLQSKLFLSFKFTKKKMVVVFKMILKANGVSIDLLNGQAIKDTDGDIDITIGSFPDKTKIEIDFGILAMTKIPKAIFILSQTSPNKSYQVIPKDPRKYKTIKSGELWEGTIKYVVK